MSIHESVVIRITGDSGDGVQMVGEQLTITAALTGRDVQTLPDFPAEIRAPAGTVGGISGFQLAMAEQAIFTAGETLDVLVALNPAALKHSLQYLDQDGILILNEDSMQAKDWEKAGCDPSLLSDAHSLYQIISVPLVQLTLQAVTGLDISQSDAKKAKNCYVLGLVLWLFDLPTDECLNFLVKKFQKTPQILEANQRALIAGYNYAMTLELSKRPRHLGQVERVKGDYRHITGVEAIALGIATVAVSTQIPMLVAGYPITPSSAILQECAKLQDYGVQLFQAEDEISAICACLGAAFAGSLAITSTSGPGLDLKSESLGLAVMSELPLVVLDVQRAGASTGLPTKTSQSDLNQALFGRHGEAPLPVLAANTPADCFDTIIEAFRIATRYMTPVIVLIDAYLATAAQSWKIPELSELHCPKIEFNRFPKPFTRDDHLSRSWNIPGTPGFIHQLGGLEKQGEEGRVSYDAQNHQHMVDLRAKKIVGIAQDYAPLVIEGHTDATILLMGWGSTYGSLKSVLPVCEEAGIKVALLHLRYLNPLPQDLSGILDHYPHIYLAELNSGQLCQVLRAQYLKDIQSIGQCNGQPFSTNYLFDQIRELTYARDQIHER
ncbi:MAG: 2-oxoglutarate ferredoxin oxidoreductase subunit alpha [Legionella sp.]|nr:MAG: 2-oxoglutarate ferredoxin oxidoreductase subunit alpha [Legionella sp.]